MGDIVQPYLNGNRPDIVIMNPEIGVTFFEVKDWQPGLYRCKDNRFYVLDGTREQAIMSPVKQVVRYRDNLTGFCVPEIGEKIDENNQRLAVFGVVVVL